MTAGHRPKIAVMTPVYNEVATVAKGKKIMWKDRVRANSCTVKYTAGCGFFEGTASQGSPARVRRRTDSDTSRKAGGFMSRATSKAVARWSPFGMVRVGLRRPLSTSAPPLTCPEFGDRMAPG